MWLKFLLSACFILSLVGSSIFERQRERGSIALDSSDQGHVLRLMSWNIGNGDLESDSRAHSHDLPAVAQVILDNDADAVAIQELTGADQLKVLLSHLKDRYRGYVCSAGKSDRVEGVLLKNRLAAPEQRDRRRGVSDGHVRFHDLPAGDRFAATATFRLRNDLPEVVLISAHADAFNARRRRVFSGEVVDWAHSRTKSEIVFVAGDFNFEVTAGKETNLFTDDAKHDSETYAGFLRYFRDLGRDAGETSINDRRIDYIFGAPDKVSLRRAEVLRGAAVGSMDHWPLLIEVALYGVR